MKAAVTNTLSTGRQDGRTQPSQHRQRGSFAFTAMSPEFFQFSGRMTVYLESVSSPQTIRSFCALESRLRGGRLCLPNCPVSGAVRKSLDELQYGKNRPFSDLRGLQRVRPRSLLRLRYQNKIGAVWGNHARDFTRKSSSCDCQVEGIRRKSGDLGRAVFGDRYGR